jgi:L-arabinokinase
MTQVIRSLRDRNPYVDIHVRSAAPARIFEPLRPESVEPCDIDAGLIETDPLTIDRDGSLRRLHAFMARRDAIVAEEVAAVRRLNPRLIVADIPFLAGDVAADAGVPCVGISNFTWDWIYENLFRTDASYASLAPVISDGYAQMSVLLELPFGRTSPAISRKIITPLIAMKSRRTSCDVLAHLGISPDDPRPRVLFGTRGGLSRETLDKVAAESMEFLFLVPHGGAGPLPANVMTFTLSPSLDFSDVSLVVDIMVSKLGYGIVSECIATQTRLVWPKRLGFAEDQIVAVEAPKFLQMVEMTREDYRSGRWEDYLRKAMMMKPSIEMMPTDGAEVCAAFIERFE